MDQQIAAAVAAAAQQAVQQQGAALQQQVEQRVEARLQQALQQQQQLAAAAVAAPPPRGAHTARPKLAPPSTYAGSAGAALDNWLRELQQQFEWYAIADDGGRLALAAAHLRGTALDWWHALAVRPTSWSTDVQGAPSFLTALRARFQPVNSAQTARMQLDELKQGTRSVQEYITQFNALLARVPDMAESDRLHRFVKGLRGNIAAQLRVQGVATLYDAVQMAARVGTLLELGSGSTLAANVPSSGGPSAMDLSAVDLDDTGAAIVAASDTGAASAPTRVAQLEQRLALMQHMQVQMLNALQGFRSSSGRGAARDRVPGLTPEQLALRLEKGLCFACGEPGHQKRNCTNKKPAGKTPGKA
jgi:hypothetical protein